MVEELKTLEAKKGIRLGFICIGSYGKLFFIIFQTEEVISVENTTEKGIPDVMARRFKRAFPLDDEARREELIQQTRTRPHISNP